METNENNSIIKDDEKMLIKKFKKHKTRTKEEIDRFIEIILASREQPDKNPQIERK